MDRNSQGRGMATVAEASFNLALDIHKDDGFCYWGGFSVGRFWFLRPL